MPMGEHRAIRVRAPPQENLRLEGAGRPNTTQHAARILSVMQAALAGHDLGVRQ